MHNKCRWVHGRDVGLAADRQNGENVDIVALTVPQNPFDMPGVAVWALVSILPLRSHSTLPALILVYIFSFSFRSMCTK